MSIASNRIESIESIEWIELNSARGREAWTLRTLKCGAEARDSIVSTELTQSIQLSQSIQSIQYIHVNIQITY